MNWLQAIILGLVQGLTEFLPVSSSGHLAIFKELLGVEISENTSFIKIVPDFPDGLAVCVAFENLLNKRGRQRVDFQVLVLVQLVTQGNAAAIVPAFEGIFFLPSVNLRRQLRTVILGHTFQHGFQDDALRAFGDMLCGRNDLDAILFQNVLKVGAVVA